MMHQCSVFTTKAQYDRSILLLENILSLDSTRDALGLQCVDAIQVLMNKLVGKERLLVVADACCNLLRSGVLVVFFRTRVSAEIVEV